MIITALGWTFEYVNKLSMGYALELLEYWRENPPTHVSVFNAWFEKPKPATFSDIIQHSKEIGLPKGRARKAPPLVLEALRKVKESHARI